jgi:hypothetical protein
MSIGYGAPLVAVVAMKPIATELVTARSGPSTVAAVSYIGSAFGGIVAGWLAGKFGVRRVVLFGALMVGSGLALSASGGLVELIIGHGLLIGLLGPTPDLCQPVVRAPPWVGGGADRLGPGRRGRDLAAHPPVRRRRDRLARHNACLLVVPSCTSGHRPSVRFRRVARPRHRRGAKPRSACIPIC